MKIKKITKKEPRVTCATWQSIYKLPKSWFKEYEMVIGDEVHQFKAKSLQAIMDKLSNAGFRIGTTGTLDGTQVSEHVLEGCFGPVFVASKTKELIEKDILSDVSIEVINLRYSKDERSSFGKRKYADEIDYLVTHSRRNEFIKQLALGQTGNTLILFNFVDKHGKPLFELIKKAAGNRPVFYVSGEVSVEDRESIRMGVEREENCIIVASTQTYSTGINIKNLHNLIFASPNKSQIRVLQSIGRTLRKAPNGQAAKIIDIADDLSYKTRKNYALKHAAERVKIYIKEKFKFSMTTTDI